MVHITDWKPGRVSSEYRDNYDRIFKQGSQDQPTQDQLDQLTQITQAIPSRDVNA